MQDAALANELCGGYFYARKDFYWATYYYTSAAKLYRDWGATAKVEQLLQQRGDYIQLNGSSSGTEMKSLRRDRRWLIERVAEASSDFTPIEMDYGGASSDEAPF